MPITVFADGASSGNPGPGGWGAVIVDEDQQVQELAGGDLHTTNNRMELEGVLTALQLIEREDIPGDCVNIYTDSTYVIRGITGWIFGWLKNGWKTAEGKDVLNRDLWESLHAAVHALSSKNSTRKLNWNYVPGHCGIPGNERVDQIAVQMSQNSPPSLYRGSLAEYPTRILEIPSQEELKKLLQNRDSKEKKTVPAKGPSYYLSLVDQTLARHSTWAECEARVRGVSGARTKKVSSLEEEKEVLKSWGMTSD